MDHHEKVNGPMGEWTQPENAEKHHSSRRLPKRNNEMRRNGFAKDDMLELVFMIRVSETCSLYAHGIRQNVIQTTVVASSRYNDVHYQWLDNISTIPLGVFLEAHLLALHPGQIMKTSTWLAFLRGLSSAPF